MYCAGAKLGLYGHTHQPLCRWTDGLTLLNPGSIGYGLRPTFALVTLKNGELDCEIVHIDDDNRG